MKRNVNMKIAKILVVLLVIGTIGMASAAIGRFTPTHAIVEPVYCGSCHPDQIGELADTTHLAHFAAAVNNIAEENGVDITDAEAVSGGCVMCHNTWANSEKMFVSGYDMALDGNGESEITMNTIVAKSSSSSVMEGVDASEVEEIRLGSGVTEAELEDEDGDYLLEEGVDFNLTANGVILWNNASGPYGQSANLTSMAAFNSTITIEYKVTNPTATFKEVWGDLSANSPNGGHLIDDVSGGASCGNPEKALCHFVETAAGMTAAGSGISEGENSGARAGTFFQHEMGYTSAEYAAKQVKLCGVCHVNKLPPMTAEGEPIRQSITEENILYRNSHGATVDTSNVTMISSDWAHKGVQCIRCHSHAGIGTPEQGTGVQSGEGLGPQ